MKKCKYCGQTKNLRLHERDGAPICSNCEAKYPLALRFVAECNRIKRLLGIELEGDAEQ